MQRGSRLDIGLAGVLSFSSNGLRKGVASVRTCWLVARILTERVRLLKKMLD
jgi:hypothetical protein